MLPSKLLHFTSTAGSLRSYQWSCCLQKNNNTLIMKNKLSNMFAYLDNIVFAGIGKEGHVTYVHASFKVVKQANLTFNENKSVM